MCQQRVYLGYPTELTLPFRSRKNTADAIMERFASGKKDEKTCALPNHGAQRNASGEADSRCLRHRFHIHAVGDARQDLRTLV
jgi:hypothetical protein